MLEQIERHRTSSATPAVKEFELPSPPPGSVNQELPSSSSEEALPTLPTVISEEESLSLPGAQDEESAPPPSTSPSSSATNDVPEQSLPPQSAAVPAEVGAGHFSLSIIKELQQGCQTLTLCLWLTCESRAGASRGEYYCGFNWTGRRSTGGRSCLAQPSN